MPRKHGGENHLSSRTDADDVDHNPIDARKIVQREPHLANPFSIVDYTSLLLGLKGSFCRENSTDDTPQGPIHARSLSETLPHHCPVVYREPDREGLINEPKIELNSAEFISQEGALRKSSSAQTV